MNKEQELQLADLISETIIPAIVEDLGIDSHSKEYNKAIDYLIKGLLVEKTYLIKA